MRRVLTAIGTALIALAGAAVEARAADYKVLHVMSYDSDWAWNRDQFAAFQAQLEGLDVEYRVIEMDTRRRSDPDWLAEISGEARRVIDEWRPDLVYTNDDSAQKHVVADYPADLTRFVFSGVNAAPDVYGFDGRSDVTGVLEREHIAQTLRLLRELAPDARRVALFVDGGATWPGLVARIEEVVATEPDLGIEIVGVHTVETYAEYRRLVSDYPGKADALGVLGVFTLKDDQGRNAPFEEVLRWTAENSTLPDFSFWGSRTELGTLCAVTVSAKAQGAEAGRMARAILLDGVAPGDIEMVATPRGEPVINLRRARALGLTPTSSTLLGARVVTGYGWD